eukprot:2939406-Alexandrium_andersonii.AAC.1
MAVRTSTNKKGERVQPWRMPEDCSPHWLSSPSMSTLKSGCARSEMITFLSCSGTRNLLRTS